MPKSAEPSLNAYARIRLYRKSGGQTSGPSLDRPEASPPCNFVRRSKHTAAWTFLIIAASCATADAPKPAEPLCGRLSDHHGLSVLELWGSPRQAGYAHGYLLAEDVIDLIDRFMLDEKIVSNPGVYEALLVPTVRRQFVWSDEHTAELDAILKGVRDRLGGEARSEVLGRELTVEDLMAGNTLADWFGMFCSTFSVWGPLTKDGQTITARNLDFFSTTTMQRQQLIIIRRGNGSARSWISAGWPGMIGVYTAMNSDGVTILMHDARGLKPTNVLGFTPRSLILREALEGASAANFIDDVAAVFKKRRVAVGNNIHVSAPARAGRPPAAVFEYDANANTDDGVTIRLADSNGVAAPSALWCTNHHRLRQPPQECWRYQTLTERLTAATTNGARFDSAKALDLIRKIKQDLTLHTVCLLPDAASMRVLIPALCDNVVEFKLNDWLNRPITSNKPDKMRPEGDKP